MPVNYDDGVYDYDETSVRFDGNVTISASCSAPLGTISGSANGAITVLVSCSSPLGGVSASSSGFTTVSASCVSALGGIAASAVVPFVPVGPQYSGHPYLSTRRQIKKQKSEIQPVVTIEETISTFSVILGTGRVGFGGAVSSALGDVSFSAEEDDLEVLLLV
jgi:hypothetical protein